MRWAEEGRVLQRAFAQRLTEGLSAEDLAHFPPLRRRFQPQHRLHPARRYKPENNRSEEPK